MVYPFKNNIKNSPCFDATHAIICLFLGVTKNAFTFTLREHFVAWGRDGAIKVQRRKHRINDFI